MSIYKVVQGLQCCTNWKGIEDCTECPYLHSPEKCNVRLMKDALDLIDEQQAEIERLNAEKKKLERKAMKKNSRQLKVQDGKPMLKKTSEKSDEEANNI